MGALACFAVVPFNVVISPDVVFIFLNYLNYLKGLSEIISKPTFFNPLKGL